ncbi:hypothetical protein niasHT_025843 [Heterodera trifolii]|uniref:Uncharacterized protein n=1 Tax=Heterodera trifolii TaxID=157864 RepID=A0ABD2KJ24_9BILA
MLTNEQQNGRKCKKFQFLLLGNWGGPSANGRTDVRTIGGRIVRVSGENSAHKMLILLFILLILLNPFRPTHPISSMATTVASIVLQLLVLGTVVHLSYGEEKPKCWHSFRHVNHKNGSELQPEFKEIFVKVWKREQIDIVEPLKCYQQSKGCRTITCTNPDGDELFRINGCQLPNDPCPDEFKTLCAAKYDCKKCDLEKEGHLCNNQTVLVKAPTLNIHIESMPFSGVTGAMPTTAIGSASAKLIIAIIGNAVLLLTMRGHHNAGKKNAAKNMAIVQIQ